MTARAVSPPTYLPHRHDTRQLRRQMQKCLGSVCQPQISTVTSIEDGLMLALAMTMLLHS